MKISIVGAGQVGGQAAFLIASAGLGDVVLFDTKPGLAQGKALDIGQSLILMPGSVAVTGGADWRLTACSNIVVVTAGLARRPGMTRQDLLSANAAIVCGVVREAMHWSPDAIIVVVTNPINTMTYLSYKVSEVDSRRVIGMAGLLDNARFSYFLAKELIVAREEIESWVIGDHGEHLVPVLSQTFIAGRRCIDQVSISQMKELWVRTRNAGTEILNYLRDGSAYFAPGAAICRTIKAITQKENVPLPCSVFLQGEYGEHDVMAGVPAILGPNGVEEIVELALDANERAQFAEAVAHIRERNREIEHFYKTNTKS